MIFVDSSVLIAAARKSDENHARAIELLRKHVEEKFIVTEIVASEVVTFVSKRTNPRAGYETGKRLVDSEQFEIVFSTRDHLLRSLETLKKYCFDSLCDALSIEIMREQKISRICSFDSDFDRVPGIKRIH